MSAAEETLISAATAGPIKNIRGIRMNAHFITWARLSTSGLFGAIEAASPTRFNTAMPQHVVSQGECLNSIAANYGFVWKTIWNHPDNADLKAERKNPNVLYPDDVLVIPDKTIKEESAATEQTHRFKRKGVPALLKIRLLNNGQPRKNYGWKANLGGEWQG